MTVTLGLWVLFGIWLVWQVNAFIGIRLSSKACERNLEKGEYGKVPEVYEYHSPFRRSTWFGFKPWVHPYRAGEDNDIT